jgi:hypothetical protein
MSRTDISNLFDRHKPASVISRAIWELESEEGAQRAMDAQADPLDFLLGVMNEEFHSCQPGTR